MNITPYYLELILLKDCYYSDKALSLVKKLGINHKNITVSENKDRFKKKPTDTFPLIFLKRHNRVGDVFIGGYDELYKLYQLFYKKSYNKDNVEKYMNEYKMNKHTILRLIQLINISIN
jgi:glutaredoxin